MTTDNNTRENDVSEQALSIWLEAERKHIEAALANNAASRARLAVSKEAIAQGQSEPWHHPTVAALIKVEKAAHDVEHAAAFALVGTPAPDWRAWVIKLDLVREYLDDVLGPFDAEARKGKSLDKRFPGTRRLKEAHHSALALYAGVARTGHSERIPALLLKACAELGIVPDANASAARLIEPAARPFGLAMLLKDAARLVASAEKGGEA